MAVKLGERHNVRLYTQEGKISELLVNSSVDVVETPTFTGEIPRPLERVLPLGDQDRVKIAMALWAHRNGLVDQMNDELDILIMCQWVDDLLLSNLVDVPTAYLYHRFDNVGIGTKLREKFSQTEYVLANSNDTAEKMAETLDYEVDRVIYPGVDTKVFRPDIEPVFSSEPPTILFVGRFIEEKGLFDLLEAFSNIESAAQLILVGRGNTESISSRCLELGISDSVRIEGEVSHTDLPGFYAAADIFCLPTHSESFGLVNVEAMACGTPVVTSDLKGIRAYLSDGENGLLTQPGDADDITEKLERFLSSPELRNSLGQKGRKTVREFTWEKQAIELASFCSEVLEIDERAEATPPLTHSY